ncbi:hypothetical protein M408DRAFT_325767 [Serendipita vermifera MAFF 305830]|uniref:DUF1640 domain-containing protein n=1 Tax=Serendipita vermifera MAFF 305830 TaxID=933852 RepID=A0A0C3BSG5_SERVB|nr:hypothetical protein M408DRAFT_94215 [Serendipita vermifera MAFF 305830]KIM34341.1 hypothetical protein M408DRAFT_325767 [Serendipita vermifera MAFF 305830]
MASCLLASSRRADRLLLQTAYALRTPSSGFPSVSGATTGLRWDASIHNKHRELSTSTIRTNYHFDTHHFVQRLEREGLTRGQAEGVMNSMTEVIDESIRSMTRNMVTKSEQEKAIYTQKVDFGQLKTELQLMERNDLATLKAENDRLMADLEKLKQRLREEITRTQAGVRLDLNLEKGRLRDENGQQEIKIREVETRIETEIAGLRTAIQTSKATTLQYLVTFVTGCSALLMAYMRFRF